MKLSEGRISLYLMETLSVRMDARMQNRVRLGEKNANELHCSAKNGE